MYKRQYINSAAESIGEFIESYKLVVVKSTVPVGTSMKVDRIIKKQIKKRKVNIDFDIANNPEFLKEGKAVNDFMFPDRIVVGLNNDKNKKIFQDLYKPFSIHHDKLIFMDILVQN